MDRLLDLGSDASTVRIEEGVLVAGETYTFQLQVKSEGFSIYFLGPRFSCVSSCFGDPSKLPRAMSDRFGSDLPRSVHSRAGCSISGTPPSLC